MRREQPLDVEIREIVGMGHEKWLVGELGPVGEHGATRAEQFIFVNEVDPVAPPRLGDMSLHLLCEPVGVQERPLDAAFENEVEPIVQKRPVVHTDQAFRRRVGQRAQPASDAGGEQKGTHDGILLVAEAGFVDFLDQFRGRQRQVADPGDLESCGQ